MQWTITKHFRLQKILQIPSGQMDWVYFEEFWWHFIGGTFNSSSNSALRVRTVHKMLESRNVQIQIVAFSDRNIKNKICFVFFKFWILGCFTLPFSMLETNETCSTVLTLPMSSISFWFYYYFLKRPFRTTPCY